MAVELMRQELHWFKVWLTIGWFMVALVIYLSLTPRPIEIDVTQGDKVGHVIAYLALMLWFAQLYGRGRHLRWGLGFVVLGIALEYVQGWTGYRSFDYFDMAADALGVFIGWCLGGTTMSRLLIGLERSIII